MADYNVKIGNVEGNPTNTSVTGTVNGTEVGAVVLTSSLTKAAQQNILHTGKLSSPEAMKQIALLEAMVDALLAKGGQATEDVSAAKVTRP